MFWFAPRRCVVRPHSPSNWRVIFNKKISCILWHLKAWKKENGPSVENDQSVSLFESIHRYELYGCNAYGYAGNCDRCVSASLSTIWIPGYWIISGKLPLCFSCICCQNVLKKDHTPLFYIQYILYVRLKLNTSEIISWHWKLYF